MQQQTIKANASMDPLDQPIEQMFPQPLIDFVSTINWGYIVEELLDPESNVKNLQSWIIPDSDGKLLSLIPPPAWEKLGEARPDGYTLGFMYLGLYGQGATLSDGFPFLSGKISSIKLSEGHYDNQFNSRYVDIAELQLPIELQAQDVIKAAINNYNPKDNSFNSKDFLHALGIDYAPPALLNSSTATYSRPIRRNEEITLTFSEPVKAGDGQILLINTKDDTDTRRLSTSDTSQIRFSGNLVDISPAARLRAGGNYMIKVENESITDLAGNKLIADHPEFKFTVNRRPTVKLFGTIAGTDYQGVQRKIFSANGTQEKSLYRLLDELFVWGDPDGGKILRYEVDLRDSVEQSGFLRFGSSSRLYGPQNVTFNQLSKLNYVAGAPGTAQTIWLRVFDGTEWSLYSSADLRTNRAPNKPLITNVTFNSVSSGVPFGIDESWLSANTSDPDGDRITGLRITDLNSDAKSGYFTLNGTRIGTNDEVTAFTIKPEELKMLKWHPGRSGREDPIEVMAIDSHGDTSETARGIWKIDYGPTEYSITSTSGINHVTEGNTFQVQIKKENNDLIETTLKYAIFNPEGKITGGRNDFSNVPEGWQELRFAPTNGDASVATLDLKTRIEENWSEGSETVRLWTYNPSKDNKNEDWLNNPAYQYLDFHIHDQPHYVMLPSATRTEGEKAVMSVARFGGRNSKSTVKLQTVGLPKAYPGIGAGKGIATANSDFEVINQNFTFTQDYDSITGERQLFTASAQLHRDSTSESGEVFAWNLSRIYNGQVVKVNNGLRTVTILDPSPTYQLQSLEWLTGFFNNVKDWFLRTFLGSQDTKVGKELRAKVNANIPARLPGTLSSMLVPIQNGLIGVDGGSLIGVDAGSLIGVDAGSLIGVDAGSLIGVDAGSLLGSRGTFISNSAANAMSKLANTDGTPLIAAGGQN